MQARRVAKLRTDSGVSNLPFSFDAGALGALLSVLAIDVVLAGDNAIAVGMAAAGLTPKLRRRVILAGVIAATVLRVLLSLVAVQLLAIIGLTLAGGLLLLWVAWKLYRDMQPAERATVTGLEASTRFWHALLRILAADVSMSLDNVLAIAGAARNHLFVLVLGLFLSVALMGVASALVARLMARHSWIGWLGLAIVTAVALRLIYDGSAEIFARLFV
jgi:YjbE family integral membrane protein